MSKGNDLFDSDRTSLRKLAIAVGSIRVRTRRLLTSAMRLSHACIVARAP